MPVPPLSLMSREQLIDFAKRQERIIESLTRYIKECTYAKRDAKAGVGTKRQAGGKKAGGKIHGANRIT